MHSVQALKLGNLRLGSAAVRCVCSTAVSGTGFCCFPLGQRRLLRLQGPDTDPFLQGLITSDMKYLRPEAEGRRALYAHLLNLQGRTLYDVILYRLHTQLEEEPDILLECDVSALEPVQKHLKMYKIRKKVTIAPCLHLSLWAVLPWEQPEDAACTFTSCPDGALILTPDPRATVMGWRMVTDKDKNPLEIVANSQLGDVKNYHRHRYHQGIPEGVKDLPPGVALPLESNLAYMNGICFSKGCYLGQELTARTHHTGVIRKRLVPVQFSSEVPIPEGAEVLTQAGKAAGKYRAGQEDIGLALLRLVYVKEELHLKIAENTRIDLSASIPEWWPKASNN
ncbi:putative transferase CAF17, mitochondrial [Microcaecilia unicolor]|nr:putative transferase CAF17, mitochondrial [Microcaecilia unicolor]